jgi:hypothetical protein
VLEWIQRDRFMRFKVNGGSVALLFLAGVLASPTTWATDPADKARRPPLNLMSGRAPSQNLCARAIESST